MDFQAIRKEYEDRGLQPDQLGPDPLAALAVWMKEATEQSPGRWFEPNAMSLATTDLVGNVTVRLVLLKGIQAEGILFFSNYDSLKGKQLAENPRAAVALHWPYQGRQVRIEGRTEKTDRAISETYFHSRPVGAQLSASVSPQSSPLPSRSELEQQKESLAERLAGESVPLPDHWGGYWLRPDRFEFWQGRSDRLHDRVVFSIDPAGTWEITRLAP